MDAAHHADFFIDAQSIQLDLFSGRVEERFLSDEWTNAESMSDSGDWA